jgi:tetratricopeptide (TPR) repeat protein
MVSETESQAPGALPALPPSPALREAAAAVRAAPADAATLGRLAEALKREGHDRAALAILERALALADPGVPVLEGLEDADLLLRAGVRLGQEERLEAALTALERAVAARPALTRGWTNRAVALCKLGRFREALACTRTAEALDPACAEARFGSAVALLALGAWEEGFPLYEARWDLPGAARPRLASPRWQGEDYAGRTLLVLGEQGFGDMLMFFRFIQPAAERGGRLILQVPDALHRLLASEALCWPGAAPPHDLHCPLMSLPGVLGLGPATVPPAPYLRADPAATQAWRDRLPRDAVLRVGLVWAGGGRRSDGGSQQPDAGRSVPAAALSPLGAVAGVCFVSLQLGDGVDPAPFPLLDLTAGLRDFADTAALMAALDLVITVDTAAVHLAGALGRPVWLLRRFAVDWRFPGGTTSFWYPTLRIFAQPRPGDWQTPLRQAAADLAALAAARAREVHG